MNLKTNYDVRMPTRIVHGAGSRDKLPEILGKSRPLVVSDKGLVEAGIVDKVLHTLDSSSITYAVYDGVLPNPPARCVQAGARIYTKERCSSIVAIGGGSAMDVAKMIGVVIAHDTRIDHFLGSNKVTKDIPPLFCIATTYGTGSEVTPFAVLTNPKTHNKDPVISWRIAPHLGILDPELCVALPASVGAPTGMDALTHAIESYINLLATPITEAFSLQAISLIGNNIRLACANDTELIATENMLIASMLAGLAFSQTRLGNVHAMSHPVGAQYGVHHGLANAILLPYVMEFNLPSRTEKYSRIANALGANVEGLSSREAAEIAIDCIWTLNRDLQIPETLGECGVKQTGIKKLSEVAVNSGNVVVNPRKTVQKDIETIFKRAI